MRDNRKNSLRRMPSPVENYVISISEQTFGFHYLKPDAGTIHTILKEGERIPPRFNRRGTEFLGIVKGSATINGVVIQEGEVLRIDTGEIVEINGDNGCELVSHIMPYRKALVHTSYVIPIDHLHPIGGRKVSIVVIAKDIESYISHALISCLNQTYSNIEIIVVNDNSKDDTGKRAESMARFDPRIQVHNVVAGANGARRYGLEQASGDYFLIMDGDDWLNEDAVEHLLATALNLDSDLVQLGFDHYNDLNRHSWDWNYPSSECQTDVLMPEPREDKHAQAQARHNHTIWMNFFSVRLRGFALTAMRDLYLYEDLPFSLSLMQHANNPAFCNLVLYHYRRERGGQATHTWSTVPPAQKQACLRVSVLHTLNQLDRGQAYYHLILLYKIHQIIDHELHITSGTEADAWHKLMRELFGLFPADLHDRLFGAELRYEFRKAHVRQKANP